MPRRCDKKCRSTNTPRRHVIESLNICTYRRKIPSLITTNVTVSSSPQTPCSSNLSTDSLREHRSCTEQTCCNNTNNTGNYQNHDDGNEFVCSGSCNISTVQFDENNQGIINNKKSGSSSVCYPGVSIKTVKEAIEDFKQSSLPARSQAELTNNGSDMPYCCCEDAAHQLASTNTPTAAQVAQKEKNGPCTKLPMSSVGIKAQQTENKNLGNSSIQDSQTISCPSKIPNCCMNKHQEIPKPCCPVSSVGIEAQPTENKNLENSVIQDSQTISYPSKIPNCCMNKPHETPKPCCHVIDAPQDQQIKNTDPSISNAGTQVNKLSENSMQTDALGVRINGVEPIPEEKRFSLPASGTPFNSNKPTIPTSLKVTKSRPDITKEPASKPCYCTSPEMDEPKKCSCHFPPAYNQFGCTGNISGNCNCVD